MSYIIDTDILSATRYLKRNKHLEVWLRSLNHQDVFISVITVGEIRKGIEKQKTINPNFANDLYVWLEKILVLYSDRILPVTIPIAMRWGVLSQHIGNSNADIIIASTALEHNLTVVTANSKHFVPTKVSTINPLLPQ